MSKWYVGKRFHGKSSIFSSEKTPTHESHAHTYQLVEGPFNSKSGAEVFTRAKNQGYEITVSEAERIALYPDGHRSKWYVGKGFHGRRSIFSSPHTPTDASHGHTYRVVQGPFKTKAGAEEFATSWNAGSMITQDAAERIASSRGRPPSQRTRQ